MFARSLRVTLFTFLGVLAMTAPAAAFCGFYVGGGDAKLFNDATQVVLLRDGKKTVLSMQNAYKGPAKDFAMVVPVPQVLQKENVKTLKKSAFDKIDRLSAPRLVEYWEHDPCKPFRRYRRRGIRRKSVRAPSSANLGGKVKVEAKFKVGEYDIVILSATESTALDTWLRQNKYNIPKGAEPYFKPYIDQGMYFFVAKVNLDKVKYVKGRAVLSPLRFHYESEDFKLPIRLGMINSSGKQDLITYILARGQRYEVANYDNATIPTNIEVANKVKKNFGGFYKKLFSETVEKNPGAVVTEYSWRASKCDPCPGPALQPSDVKTFGLDVLDNQSWRGWTLTRLHARYKKDRIGEDLVFRKAEPIVGGREVRKKDGSLETGAKKSTRNAFQGRYIIRHEWTGKVTCDKPKFGRWGGPSGRKKPSTSANVSENTQGPKPKKTKKVSNLTSWVRQDVPEIGVKAKKKRKKRKKK